MTAVPPSHGDIGVEHRRSQKLRRLRGKHHHKYHIPAQLEKLDIGKAVYADDLSHRQVLADNDSNAMVHRSNMSAVSLETLLNPDGYTLITGEREMVPELRRPY